MSYRRLNLQDFKDVWTAANISHIEDGVINNETELGAIKSTVTNMESQLKDLVESELLNSILPLWHTLLSNGGEKIFPPTFSFDGNIIGKTFLPITPEGKAEAGVGYVRIGDDIGTISGVMTCGGLYHVLSQVLPVYFPKANIFGEMGLEVNGQLGFQLLMGLTMIQGEDNYDYGDNPVTIYNSMAQQLFNSMISNVNFSMLDFPSLNLPTAFSINRSFEYNGVVYPSGFYSLYIHSQFYSNAITDLPLIYVDKFWKLTPDNLSIKQLNMPLDYSKASNAFECFGESIFWNGIDNLNTDIIIPFDHMLSQVKCISYNPQAFLEACTFATEVVMIDENNNEINLSVEPLYSSEDMRNILYMLGDKFLIAPSEAYEGNYCIAPGVYVFQNQSPFELQFHGVDTQKLFNKHEINSQYLPDVPEFNLADMGMSNVSLDGNFVTLNVNTTKLKFCSRKGPVRITIPTEMGEVSCLATFNDIGSTYQSVITGYYAAIKFDTVIIFTDDDISVGIIPVSQLA